MSESFCSTGERLLRALTEHSAEAISVLDARGAIAYANREFHRLFGDRRGQPIAQWTLDLVHPDDAAPTVAAFHALARTPGAVGTRVYRVRDREGTWRTRSTIAQNLLDDPVVAGIVLISRDVTEQQRAVERLRASEERFRTLSEASPVGVFETDHEGNVTYVNARLLRMRGLTEERDLLGTGWLAGMHPEDQEPVRHGWIEAMQAGREFTGECRVNLPDGRERRMRCRAAPLHGAEGDFVGAVGTVEDVTEAQRALDAQRFLLQVSSELTGAVDLASTLEAVARTAVPFLGDRCVVYVAGADGEIAPAGRGPVDDADARLAAAAIRTQTPTVGSDTAAPATVAAGVSWSRMAVPLVAHDRALGALVLGADAARRFDVVDLGVAQSLAGRAAAALDTARLLDEARAARHQAEALESEQRALVAALRESEARHRLLFERSPLPIWVADAETRRFLSVNDAAVRQYGYTREEFLSMRLDDIRPPEERARFAAQFTPGRASGPVGLSKHQRKDGTIIDVEITSELVSIGDTPARLALAHDVTERQHAEAARRAAEIALMEARRQTELLLTSAGEGIYALDTNGRVTFVNPTAARLFGAPAECLLGRDLHGTIHHSHADGSVYPVTESPIAATLRDGAVHRVDTDVFWREDGTSFPVEYVSTPLREDGKIVGAVVAFQDITHRKQLELQLVQAQKMEAVGRLAGGVAHDFNNLLTVITGYTAMLLTELPTEDPIRPDLHEVQAATQRAAGLTRQLLAFSRRQVLSPRVVDLRRVVDEMETMLQRIIGEDIVLTLAGDDTPAHVLADPGQLEQVVMNLVVNARDAMPTGGSLTIEIGAAALTEEDRKLHPYVVPGEYVCLRVRDSGCGMDEATLQRIFEPFFTTKEQGKGTGLGLATVYGIVKQSGGYVWVDSAPESGSTFRVYLPLVGDAPDEVGETPAATAAVRRGATVLFVEDEGALRTIAERVLRKRGYTVLSAGGGAEALAIAERHDGPIDLLVTDVVMPAMSGQELAERLLALRLDIPVLFMTGYSMEAVANHGVLRPGSHLLNKPFGPHDLALAVSELLQAHAAPTPSGHPADVTPNDPHRA